MLGALKLWNKCSINRKSHLMWGHTNSHYALNKTRASAVWVLLLTSSLGGIFHWCNKGWTGSERMPDIPCLSCRVTSVWRDSSHFAWSDMLLYWPFALGGPMKNYDVRLQWLWAQDLLKTHGGFTAHDYLSQYRSHESEAFITVNTQLRSARR